MSGLVKKAIGCYPALANGPLAKPDGFRDASKTFMKKMSVPMAVVSLAFFGASYYFLVHRLINKTVTAFKTSKTPDELYEEIKEYGVYTNIKASWQKE